MEEVGAEEARQSELLVEIFLKMHIFEPPPRSMESECKVDEGEYTEDT